MKHAVSLYEFMPYGAPDIIESRQRHMSRALVLTSATALVFYALAGGLASLIPEPSPEPSYTVFELDRDFLPPPLVTTPPPAPAVPRVHAAPPISPHAPAVPVPDVVDTPPEALPQPSGTAAGDGAASMAVPSDVGAAPGEKEVLPSPDAPFYGEELPTVIKSVVPEYPQFARDAGVEGLVMVKVLVGKDGHVLDTRLVEKHQVLMLDGAALEAARKWVFTPALANGRPVACWTVIPFRFRLH